MRSLTLPSRGLPPLARVSPLILSWDARDLALVARTGQTLTLIREGEGTAADSAGRIRRLVHSQPRWDWADTDGDGTPEPHLLLEASRTNVLRHKRDLSDDAWTATNCTAARDQVGIDGQANTATSLTATAANGHVLQAVTLSSSERATSAFVRRLAGTGTVQMTTNGGSTWTAITVTDEWTRVSIPSATVVNPSVGVRLVTSGDAIAVDWVQNETGPTPSSPIGSPADNDATETRPAESASCTLLAPPQALTLYIACRELGTLDVDGAGLLGIGDGTDAALLIVSDSGQYRAIHRRASDAVSSPEVEVPFGEGVELLLTLSASGAVQLAASVGGAPPVAGDLSSALGLAAAWHDTTLTIGDAGSTAGLTAMRALKIAAGARSLNFMRLVA